MLRVTQTQRARQLIRAARTVVGDFAELAALVVWDWVCVENAVSYVDMHHSLDLDDNLDDEVSTAVLELVDRASQHTLRADSYTQTGLRAAWTAAIETELEELGIEAEVDDSAFPGVTFRRKALSREQLTAWGLEPPPWCRGAMVSRVRGQADTCKVTLLASHPRGSTADYDKGFNASEKLIRHNVRMKVKRHDRRATCVVVSGHPGTGKTYAVLRRAGTTPTLLALQSHDLCREKAAEFLALHPDGQVIHHQGTAEVLRQRGDHEAAGTISRLAQAGYLGGKMAAILGINVKPWDRRVVLLGDKLRDRLKARGEKPVEQDHDEVPTLVVCSHAGLRQLTLGATKKPTTLAKDAEGRRIVVDEQPIYDVQHWNPYAHDPVDLDAIHYAVEAPSPEESADDQRPGREAQDSDLAPGAGGSSAHGVGGPVDDQAGQQDPTSPVSAGSGGSGLGGAGRPAGPDFVLPVFRRAARLQDLVQQILVAAWPRLQSRLSSQGGYLHGLDLPLADVLAAVPWRRHPGLRRAYLTARKAVDEGKVHPKASWTKLLAKPTRMPPPRDWDEVGSWPARDLAWRFRTFFSDPELTRGKVFVTVSGRPLPDWRGWANLHEAQAAWDELWLDEADSFGDVTPDEARPMAPSPLTAPDPEPFLRLEIHRGVPLGRVLRGWNFYLLDATADPDVLQRVMAVTPCDEGELEEVQPARPGQVALTTRKPPRPTHRLAFLDHEAQIPANSYVYKHIVKSTFRSTLTQARRSGHLSGTLFNRLIPVLDPEAGHRRVGVIGTKETHDALMAELGSSTETPELGAVQTLLQLRADLGFETEVVSGYLGNLRGTNAFRDCDALVVFTDPQPNVGASERAAEHLGMVGSYFHHHVQDAELVQALGRARLIRRDVDKLGPMTIYSVGVEAPEAFVEALGEPVEYLQAPHTGRNTLPAVYVGQAYARAAQRERLSPTGWIRLGQAVAGHDFEQAGTFVRKVLEAAAPEGEAFRRTKGQVKQAWALAVCCADLPRPRVSELVQVKGLRTPARATAAMKKAWAKNIELDRTRPPVAVVHALERMAKACPEPAQRAGRSPDGRVGLVGSAGPLLEITRLPRPPGLTAPVTAWARYWRTVLGALQTPGAVWTDGRAVYGEGLEAAPVGDDGPKGVSRRGRGPP